MKTVTFSLVSVFRDSSVITRIEIQEMCSTRNNNEDTSTMSINETIRDKIQTELLQIEKKEDLTILLAVESGSRA